MNSDLYEAVDELERAVRLLLGLARHADGCPGDADCRCGLRRMMLAMCARRVNCNADQPTADRETS